MGASFRGVDTSSKLIDQHGIDAEDFGDLTGDALPRDCPAGLDEKQGARSDTRLPRKLPNTQEALGPQFTQ